MARISLVLFCASLCVGVVLSGPTYSLRDLLTEYVEEMEARDNIEERDYCVGNPCPTAHYCYSGKFITGLKTTFCSKSANPCDNIVSACGYQGAKCKNYGRGHYSCKAEIGGTGYYNTNDIKK